MITKEELQEKYATLSPDKLMEIIDNKFDYTELAVTVAIQELSSRNITEDDVKSYKDKQVEKVTTFVKRNIVDDLNLLQKNLFFFIWFPLLTYAFRRNFAEDGYLLKLKQANYYSWAGFISVILIGSSPVVFEAELSTPTTIAIWIACFIPTYLLDEFFNRRRQIEKMQRFFERNRAGSKIEEAKEEAESDDMPR
jgi:hypothetical protein